jgi:hypothetical protein
MNESRLSMERTFDVLVLNRDEMSEVAPEQKISSIRALYDKGASEDRAHLRHQSESPTSSLGPDGTGAETRAGLDWS